MRYANPEKPVLNGNISSRTTDTTNPGTEQAQGNVSESMDFEKFPLVKQLTSKFRKVNIFAPRTATQITEQKIRKLKAHSSDWLENVKSLKIHKNYKPNQTNEIRVLSKLPNVQIEKTDKTSKIAIVDKEFAQSKIKEYLLDGGFEELDGDPSKQYEKDFNDLLKKIYSSEGNDIPDALKQALPIKYSVPPTIFSFQKDHKKEYPMCKIRPVQPIGESYKTIKAT